MGFKGGGAKTRPNTGEQRVGDQISRLFYCKQNGRKRSEPMASCDNFVNWLGEFLKSVLAIIFFTLTPLQPKQASIFQSLCQFIPCLVTFSWMCELPLSDFLPQSAFNCTRDGSIVIDCIGRWNE